MLRPAYGFSLRETDFREWRDHAWDHIEDRKHEIFNVYTAKPDYSDIMVLGLLTGSFRNGKIVSEEYIARITFDPATLATEPKSHYYKVWTVRAHLLLC